MAQDRSPIVMREQLAGVEARLVDLWLDAIHRDPELAARASVAARMVRKAAAALGGEEVLA